VKVFTIVGARPQFVKAAPVCRALRQRHQETLVHTGQHYDDNMSKVFFDELEIPKPDINLEIGSGSHGAQTGAMLIQIEKLLFDAQPNWVLVYGDTNSTLAGTLAASKLGIRVAHVEAGLRCFNRALPEEVNRVVTDHLSNLLLCPSKGAVNNLRNEGIRDGVHLVGDVMFEALSFAVERSSRNSQVLRELQLQTKKFLLATVHRAENTDDPARLACILAALAELSETVVFPVHPRTRKVLQSQGLSWPSNVRAIDPVGYLDMVQLEKAARIILTDSGGIQKEAYWLGVPCVTMRGETEWTETVEYGWNRVVGADREKIVNAARTLTPPAARPPLYGDGTTARRIVELLESHN
jgi:UDP-GlcNAc3NAcA epimerase